MENSKAVALPTCSSYSSYFAQLISTAMDNQKILPEHLKRKLRFYFAKKFPDHTTRIDWLVNNAYNRFVEDRLEMQTVFDIISALGGKLTIFVDFTGKEEPKEPAHSYPTIWDQEIDELDLPVRVTNVLKAECSDGKMYIGELINQSFNAVSKIMGMGPAGMRHLEVVLAKHSLAFSTHVGEWKSPTWREERKKMLAANISAIGFPADIENVLQLAGVNQVSHLLTLTEMDVAKIPGMAPAMQYRLTQIMERKCLHLRKE